MQKTKLSSNNHTFRKLLLLAALVTLVASALSRLATHAAPADPGERPDVVWMRGGHTHDVSSMDYSPDGQLFVSMGDSTGVIKLWRVSDGMLLRTIRVFPSGGYAVKFLADSQTVIVTGSEPIGGIETSVIKRVRLSDGQIIWSVPGGGNGVRIQLTPGGDLFLSGNGVQFFRSSDGALINSPNAVFYRNSNGVRINWLGFSDGYLAGNGNIAVSLGTGSGNYYPAIVDPNDCYTDTTGTNVTYCNVIAYFPGLNFGTRGITPDGSQILSYGGPDLTKVYRVADACFAPFSSCSSIPTAAAILTGDSNGNPTFSPDGQKLGISGSQTINVYDVSGWSLRFSQPHAGYMTTVFSPDSQVLANNNYPPGQFSSWLARVNFLRVSDGTLVGVLNAHTGMVKSVAFSPDSQLFASADNGGDARFNDRVVHIWRSTDGTLLTSFVGDTESVNSMAFSPTGPYLATGGNASVSLWNVNDGSLVRTFGSNIFAHSIAFSPDGTKLLTGGVNTSSRVNLWDVNTGTLIRSFLSTNGYTNAVAISPDGQTMAATDSSAFASVIYLWRFSDGMFLRSMSTSGDVSSIAFSPDSQSLIAGLHENNGGGRSSRVRQWQVSNGQLIRDYSGHLNWVESVAFSPDGSVIISGGEAIRMWDASTGTQLWYFDEEIGAFPTTYIGNSNVLSVAFSPDGSKIGYGRFDATAVVASNPFSPPPTPTPTPEPSPTSSPTPTPVAVTVYTGDPYWHAYEPNGTTAAITSTNPRSGSGSLELIGNSGFIRSGPPLGTYGNLNALGFDWYIQSFTDPDQGNRSLPPDIALRFYDYGDPRTFFLHWDTCSPTAGCDPHPVGSWQTTNLLGQLSIQQAENNTPPASLADIPADAPVTEIQVRGSYSFGGPWHGFADNVKIGFSGQPATIYNFEPLSSGDTLIVTNTNDDGPASLRQAIVAANNAPGHQNINFNISDSGPHTISLLSGLPSLVDTVTLDATTQPGFAGTPILELNGESAGVATGLSVLASNCRVKGFVINRFSEHGIYLPGNNNIIEGNYIGTNLNGTSSLPIGQALILLHGSNNLIGGTTPGARNVMSSSGDHQILLDGSNNTIQGNYLGTDVTGSVALGGGGIYIYAGGSNNLIGGTNPGAGNVISGNVYRAIAITDFNGGGATGNIIQGNYLGTNSAGTAALPNENGVIIYGNLSGNIVGGTTVAARNVISGNSGRGVWFDNGAHGNYLQGNYVGLDVTGTLSLPNASGVQIQDSPNNIIGGAVSARNIISGNTFENVNIYGPAASGNVVTSNYIGTNAAGTVALGGGGVGLHNGANNNLIGGTNADARNIISGNSVGIFLASDTANNLIRGNFIGTDVSGTAKLGNLTHGVDISGSNNTIGGTETGAGNLVSGNGNVGVDIYQASATGNIVQGNFIGTDVTGTSNLGNTTAGVFINQASNNLIGGATAGARNVISGNGNAGIGIVAGSTGNQVHGNFVGTDGAGAVAVPNATDGVYIDNSAGNSIGGPMAGEGNVISGSGSAGIRINNSNAAGNVVQGNYIGINVAGSAALGNSAAGISLNNSTNNLIGGTEAGARNVISKNGGQGIFIGGSGSTGNLVLGNYIGTGTDGVSNFGNAAAGVVIQGSNNTIGGTDNGAGNIIAYNGGVAGIRVAAGNGNAILSNSIFSNVNLGISLDAGANNNQPGPVLSLATNLPGGTQITGTLNGAPSTPYRVEFFSNPSCDPSGNGEGETLIGSTSVTTDATGSVTFSVTLSVMVSAGQAITSTATSSDNNTSPFSFCVTVTSGTPVISWSNPADITYGEALSGTQLNATANVPGSFDYSPAAGTVLNAGAAQTLSATFTPDDTVNFTTATASVVINVLKASTSVSLSSTTNPSSFGQSIALSATVSPIPPGAGVPSGTVQFFDNGSLIGTQPLSGGVATLNISTFPTGNHSITAAYLGDSNFTGSTSPAYIQTVTKPGTITSLTSSANPSRFGQLVTFTATVLDGAGTPTGSVEFFAGAVSLGSSNLKNGVAIFNSASLAVGSHSVTAQYNPSRNFLGSTSAPLAQQVMKTDTTTGLESSAKNNTSQFGKSVTLTATVSAISPGGGTPSGNIQFYDGGIPLGAPITLTRGQAKFSTSTLTRGSHSISCIYSGDGNFNGSSSPVLMQQVN